jgi:hypothetical protein
MRTRRLGFLLLGLLVSLGLAAGAWAASQSASSQPGAAGAATAGEGARTTWYFYKVRWGHQDEFLNLFQKNHYPVLKAYQELGRYASIRTFVPRYHGDGRADWTFAVELVERSTAAKLPEEAEMARKLFPDQATFRREERRRFEILDAHWDVPLEPVDLAKRETVPQ